MENKYELRVPTSEQYAYISCSFEGTHEEAVEEYKQLTQLVKGGTGLSYLDFNEALDRYLWGDESMEAETYVAMSPEQQFVIQNIKKSRKRINYTNPKGEVHHSMR